MAPIPQLPIVSAPALPVGEEAPRLPLVAPVQMSQATSTPVRGVPDPAERVRAVLAAYERAYSRLDADDVAALWPSVNRAALARAFAGLSHQEVRLERCAVLVDGPAARASCEGTLTWIPKVGGGRSRQQQRTWRFALNLTGETWEIVKAEMR